MPAYLIGHITVIDDMLWQQYVTGVQESLLPYDAEIVFRGELSGVLAGNHDHHLVVVIKFLSHNTLDQWFHSTKYQGLVDLRDRAANVVITTYKA